MSSHIRQSERPRFWNRVAVIAVGILFISWGGPAASAYWQSLNSNTVLPAAAADTIATGATPSVSVAGSTVTVSWAARLTTAGKPVSGYAIGRYSVASGGTKTNSSNGCSGTVTGLSCTETSVPNGTWYYTVAPAISLWRGADSTRSLVVVDTVAPGKPVFTSAPPVNFANQAAVPVSGTSEAGATVTLTVTDAGPAHTATQIVTANGSGVWTATVNLSSHAVGTITYSAKATDAAGNIGAAQTATATKDVTAPTVSDVDLLNLGSKVGVMEEKDKVFVTFAEPMAASSFCSGWNDGSNQTEKSSDVTVTISSTNVLTVSVASATCGTFRFGSVALGGSYYSAGPLTFHGSGSNASSILWNQSAKTFTVVLGNLDLGTPSAAVQSNGTPSYTPASGLTDMVGNPLGTAAVPGSSTRF